MAFTTKTIVKLFLLFLFFQLSINFLVEFIPENIPNVSASDEEYLEFVRVNTNTNTVTGQVFSTEDIGNTLLDDFVDAITKEDFFNDSLIDKFFGVLQVLGQMFLFLFQLGLLILFTPSVIMAILLYNFIVSSTLLFTISLAVNVFFYMTLFYIIAKRRTSS